MRLHDQARGELQVVFESLQEPGSGRTIHHLVVERQVEVHRLAFERSAVLQDEPGEESADSQDRDLGWIENWREEVHSEWAEAGDGERPSLQVLQLELIVTRAL